MKNKVICFIVTVAMALSLISCKSNNVSENSSGLDSRASVATSTNYTVSQDNVESNNNSQGVSSTTLSDTTSDKVNSTSDNSKTESESPEENLPTVSTPAIPTYPKNSFEISGFWAPYDISEEGLKLYKNAGFNTLAMINHSLGNTSEEQFYLGSKRTMTALENCRKVGLNAILNYNDWKAEQCEGKGYNGETPFSKYDLYGDYKDIITGVHICDEPNKETMNEIANKTLVKDFKKVYPNAKYIVNLSDITWPDGRGYANYDDLLNHYSTAVMSQFDVPYISVDCYPFWGTKDMYIIENYYKLANIAKQHDAKTTMILQSSTGNEFKDTLSEGDMRWQAYLAIAFGADSLQYYCYSLPKGIAYNYCILNEDGTPSVLYDYVKEINAEVQMFADSVLAYDWEDALVVAGTEENSLRGSCLQYNPVDFKYKKFDNAAYYVGSKGTQDVLVSRFLSEEYGEAYMFVNIAVDNGKPNNVIAEFKDCVAVAVYGGADYDGTPKIVELDKEGNTTIELNYGEGVFVTPLSK